MPRLLSKLAQWWDRLGEMDEELRNKIVRTTRLDNRLFIQEILRRLMSRGNLPWMSPDAFEAFVDAFIATEFPALAEPIEEAPTQQYRDR